jgi:O-antigen/teichoic acid export membrane protein
MSLPISVPGYVSTSLTGATISMVILNYLGHTELGVYSLALTLQGMAMVVTLAIGQMFYPKIMCKFGACEDYRASIEYTIKPTCFSLFISLGIVVVLCLTVGPFIKFVIPKYIDAVSIIRILSINIVLTAVELPFVVFISTLQYRKIILLSLIRFASCFVLIAIFPKTLSMIVWSTVLAEAAYVAVGYGLIIKANMKREFE